MAQIAGRAGRHQQDGSFGTVGRYSAFYAQQTPRSRGIISRR